MQKQQIDFFEIKIKGNANTKTVTDLDSIVVFTRSSRNIFDNQDNIIYDFANTPRQLGSFIMENASYTQKMIEERWYLVTIGFD